MNGTLVQGRKPWGVYILLIFFLFLCLGTPWIDIFVEKQFSLYKRFLTQQFYKILGSDIKVFNVSFSWTRGIQGENLHFEHEITKSDVKIVLSAPKVSLRFFPWRIFSLISPFVLEFESPLFEINCNQNDLVTLSENLNVKKSAWVSSFLSQLLIKNGKVELKNLKDFSSVSLENFELQLWNYAQTKSFTSSAILPSFDEAQINIEGNITDSENFIIGVNSEGITLNTVCQFWSAAQQYAEFDPLKFSLKVRKESSQRRIFLDWDIQSNSFKLKTTKFLFGEKNEGPILLKGNAFIDDTKKIISVLDSTLNYAQLVAKGSGNLTLASESPILDMNVNLLETPWNNLANQSLAHFYTNLDGEVTVGDIEPGSCVITFKGPVKSPVVKLLMQNFKGKLEYSHSQEDFPSIESRFHIPSLIWDSSDKSLSFTLLLSEGNLNFPKSKVILENISGYLTGDLNHIDIKTFKGEFNKSSFSGFGNINPVSRRTTITMNASIQDIERTFFSKIIKNVSLSGSCLVDGTFDLSPERFNFRGNLDATQTKIDYRWWFEKPPGIGLYGRIDTQWIFKKSAKICGEFFSYNTLGSFESEFTYQDGSYKVMKGLAEAKTLDLCTVGQCLRIPYRVRGGMAFNVNYIWERIPTYAPSIYWRSSATGVVDELELKAEETKYPFRGFNLTLAANFSTTDEKSCVIDIGADEIQTPPFGEKWFISFEPPIEMRQKYPPDERIYSYNITCKVLKAFPWEATGFSTVVTISPAEIILSRYDAKVENGFISGSYQKNRLENVVRAAAQWNQIPTRFFIQHLRLPEILQGDSSGEMSYIVDMDDPATLSGTSQFEINDGMFSADFILYELGLNDQLDSTVNLPPSLKFEKISVQTQFERDVVTTPKLTIVSPGILIEANGKFVLNGDMDYNMNVKINPEIAEHMPLIKQYLNVEGHRLAAQDIELGFRINGPTYRPRGELSQGPPVSVSLVTSGLEMVSEAVRVFDIPRKILFELFRVGGGILNLPAKK